MSYSRRIFLLQALSVPLCACSIQPLKPVQTQQSSKPSNLKNFTPQLGSTWQYIKINQYNSEPVELIEEKLVSVDNQRFEIARQGQKSTQSRIEVQQPWGMVKSDSDWDFDQTYDQEIPIYLDLNQENLSRNLHTQYQVGSSSYLLSISVYIRQYGWEIVKTQVGTFNALRIEKSIRFQHNDSTRIECSRIDRYWYAPEVGRWVIRETNGSYFYVSGRRRTDAREDFWRFELVSFT
jgi:hypothetical protein